MTVLSLLCLLSLGSIGAGRGPVFQREVDTQSAFDAAPFATVVSQPGSNEHVLRWAEPRKIRRVVVEFGTGSAMPASDSARLEYWHRTWDGRPDPVLEEAGAGGVGWHSIDDWTNGEWKEADAVMQATGRIWTFTFNPTGNREFKDLENAGVTYRKTLKVRLVSQAKLPPIAAFRVLTDAVCRPLSVRILFGRPAEPKIQPLADSLRLEVFNGLLVSAEPAGSMQAAPGKKLQWNLPANAQGELHVRVLMAVDPSGAPYDRTIVTVRSALRPFSFAADEIARRERILVDDLGALVVRGDDATTLEAYRASRAESLQKTVYERVFAEPEQTLSRAWNDMPLKHPLYFVHGLPGNRNTMRQDPDGSIRVAAGGRWFRDFPRGPFSTRLPRPSIPRSACATNTLCPNSAIRGAITSRPPMKRSRLTGCA